MSCGDRNGHPLVTPEVTDAALSAYRSAALALQREALSVSVSCG